MQRNRAAERIELILRCIDLTSLNEEDTPEVTSDLCARAVRPDAADASRPSVAAVCVYPRFVSLARKRLGGSGVRVAAVAGGFSTGSQPVRERLAEIRTALEAGADEIDTVMDHGAFLAGRRDEITRTLAASREACGEATMKVILETGALGSAARVREAARLAMEAGADFVKTSTGKIAPGATPGAARTLAQATAEFSAATGRRVGVKLSGGIRATRQALGYVAIVEEVLGPAWLVPERFRIGASSLLEDVVAALAADRE